MNKNKTQIIQSAQKIIDEAAENLAEELNRLVVQEAEYVPELAYELIPDGQAKIPASADMD